jgi:hypothetical protein
VTSKRVAKGANTVIHTVRDETAGELVRLTLCGKRVPAFWHNVDDVSAHLFNGPCGACMNVAVRASQIERARAGVADQREAVTVLPVPVLPFGIDARRCNICHAGGVLLGSGEACTTCAGTGYVLSHYAACCGTTFSGKDPRNMHADYHNAQHAAGRRAERVASCADCADTGRWDDETICPSCDRGQAVLRACMERHPAGKGRTVRALTDSELDEIDVRTIDFLARLIARMDLAASLHVRDAIVSDVTNVLSRHGVIL